MDNNGKMIRALVNIVITVTALKTSVIFWVDLVFLFTVKITTPPEIRTADGLLARSFLSL